MTTEDPDAALFRRAARSQRDAAGPLCLDAETIAAWTDGGLTAAERSAAEAHTGGCGRCRAVLAAMARTDEGLGSDLDFLTKNRDLTPKRDPTPTSRRLRWWAPAVAAALVAGVVWTTMDRGAPLRNEPPAAAVPPPQATVAATPESAPPQATAAPIVLGGAAGQGDTRAQAQEKAEARPAAPPPSVQRRAAGAALDAVAPLAAREAAAPDGSSRWRVGPAGLVERSLDGGRTWARLAPPDPADLASVAVKDADTATVTTVDGRVFTTSDGGKTWSKAPLQENLPAPF